MRAQVGTGETREATLWQKVTAGTADLAIVNTLGVAAGLLVRDATGQQRLWPVVTWLVLAVAGHLLNSFWLTGRTGQSLGERVAQIATLSPATGGPMGVANLVHVSVRGLRPFVVDRVSTAPDEER